MNYDKIFLERLEKLKQEGNYRVFADLERYKGSFLERKIILETKNAMSQCGAQMTTWAWVRIKM